MGVQSSPVTQSDPCCPSATPRLPFDLATPERVLGLPLVPQPRLSIFSSPLPKTAAHFAKESEEEREHGMKLMAYQSKRGGRCVFQDIAKPVNMEWGTCLEAMEAALELEKMVNQSLLELTKAAEDKDDSNLSDFVDEFLEEQVASIKSIGDTITKLKRVGDGLGLFLFDKEMAA